jgi:hypothetical protein
MMAASGMVTTAQVRLATYYLSKLQTVDSAFKCGHEHSIDALAQFDQEWSQIKRWRDWSAEHSNKHDDIALLCMEYPQAGSELFLLRLHPRERLEWLEAGLEAARRLGNQKAEMVHLLYLGKIHAYLGAVSTALELTQLALEMARQLDSPLYLCRSLILASFTVWTTTNSRSKRRSKHLLSAWK